MILKRELEVGKGAGITYCTSLVSVYETSVELVLGVVRGSDG
jgi:hypothetical protein